MTVLQHNITSILLLHLKLNTKCDLQKAKTINQFMINKLARQ